MHRYFFFALCGAGAFFGYRVWQWHEQVYGTDWSAALSSAMSHFPNAPPIDPLARVNVSAKTPSVPIVSVTQGKVTINTIEE